MGSYFQAVLQKRESKRSLQYFTNCFLKKTKLGAWEKTGTIPLTHAALQNCSVRHEIQEGEDTMDPWRQQEIKLQETCNKLDCLGYNAKVLKCKVERASTNSLESRVPASASEEDKIKALANCGYSMSDFYSIGAQCLNTDTMSPMMADTQRKK